MCLTTSSRQKVQSQSRFPDHRRESTAKISGETTAIAEDPKDAAAAANYHDPAELRCSSIDSITFVSANEDGVGSGHSIIEGGRGRPWVDKSDRPEGKPRGCGEPNRSDGNRRDGGGGGEGVPDCCLP